jgi:TolB-like protein/tetratricopeptide (TPR) repeat protein
MLALTMFEFVGHTLDVARSSLRTADREIKLRPKSFEVLRYLVENADRLVTKEELIKAVWPNVVATDESLAHCLSEVRQALGDVQHAVIKTLPRRGYHFAAPVARVAMKSQPLPARALPPVAAPENVPRPEPLLPDRPSIAVLPFQNMSGDVGQDYFADGIVEEIITALSRFSGLFVIARNSSFTYKGRPVDVKQVGRELGVRYVLEGSVRKAADRLRIAGQLIDATTGSHLWADRFDGTLGDILDLQDHVTTRVVTAIAPKLEQAEIRRAKRKPTESLDAYDCFLRGMECAYQDTQETVIQAQRMFYRAIDLDAEFGAAHAMAGYCYVLRKASRWTEDRASEIAEAARLAHRAVKLGRDDALSLSRAGHTLAFVVHEMNAAKLFLDQALVVNPNFASAWFSSGCIRYWLGEPDAAIKHFAQFNRMSPLDPLMPVARSTSAFAHVSNGSYSDALLEAEQALQTSPTLHVALRAFALANALSGNLERAQEAVARLRQIDPALCIRSLGELTPLRRPEDISRYAEGFRRAGLPE